MGEEPELFSPSGCRVFALSQVNLTEAGVHQIIGIPCSFSQSILLTPNPLRALAGTISAVFVIFFLLFGYRVSFMILWFSKTNYPWKQLVLCAVFRIHFLILISSFVMSLAIIPPWNLWNWFLCNTIGTYIPITSFLYIVLFEIWMKPLNELAKRNERQTSLIHSTLQVINVLLYFTAFGLQTFSEDKISRFVGAGLTTFSLIIWALANLVFAIKVMMILYRSSNSSRIKGPPLFRLSLLAFGITVIVLFVSSTGLVVAVKQLGEDHGARVFTRDALAKDTIIWMSTLMTPVWILMAFVLVIQRKSLEAFKFLFPSRSNHQLP